MNHIWPYGTTDHEKKSYMSLLFMINLPRSNVAHLFSHDEKTCYDEIITVYLTSYQGQAALRDAG